MIVVGLVPELGDTDSQLFALTAVALKIVLNPLRETLCVVDPPCCTVRFTGLGVAVKAPPVVDPGASIVTGIVRLGLADVLDVSTNHDLDILRNRADFKMLLADVEKKAKRKPEQPR